MANKAVCISVSARNLNTHNKVRELLDGTSLKYSDLVFTILQLGLNKQLYKRTCRFI